jgi:copper chaperone
MSTVKITTAPFTCPSCIAKIEKAVGRLDGVEDVTVRFNSSTVKVTFDEDRVTPEVIAGTIDGLGYPVTRVGAVTTAVRA